MPGFGFPKDRFVSAVDRTYYPKDFTDEIDARWDEKGRECEFVDSGYAHPDYSVLEGPRLDYYFWWRRCVGEGRLIAVDSGYAWLRCVELINTRRDPAEVMREIVRFTEVCSNSMRLSPMVSELAEHYALARGLSLGTVPRRRPFALSEILLTWDLTRYPIRMPDPEVLLDTSLFKWYKIPGVEEEALANVVAMTLAGMDEVTRSTSGQGFVRAIGCCWDTAVVIPFEGFADFSGPRRIQRPVLSLSEGPLHDLLDAVVRQAVVLMRDDGVRAPAVPRTFPKAYRRIVAAAVDAVLRDDPWDARSFRGPGDGCWENDDLDVFEEEGDDAPMIRPMPFPDTTRPKMTCRELDSHWDDESDAPVGYMPSDRTMASYGTMDEGQLAYYTYWRTMARRGRYLDTDQGYIWLYCTELINHDYDPEAVQKELERAVGAYYESFPAPYALCHAAVDHALVHGFDVPPEPLGAWNRYIAYSKLASEPTGRISTGLAGYMSGNQKLSKYIKGDPRIYERAFTESLRAADALLKDAEGKRIVDLAPKTEYTTSFMAYSSVWHPNPPTMRFSFRDVLDSVRITGMMDSMFRYAVRLVNERLGVPIPRMPDISRALADAVGSAVDRVFGSLEDEQRRENARREASRLRLDRDAVASAEADLDAVTGLMYVPEEEAPEPTPVREELPEAGSGWGALLASLDDVEKAYLARGQSALEGTGRRRQAVEDSINTKAMDAVGDSIMEDGEVFEEYREDVGRMLG